MSNYSIRESLAYAKNLKGGKKEVIETKLLFNYVDGKKRDPLDAAKFTVASNDYCTVDENGTGTVRHAVYACAGK